MKQGQFPAILPLASLNGKNGFTLDGEATSDWSGWSVAGGDINGDGVSDLLIGAPYRANETGRSYVIFGGSSVGSSGLMALSGLNGSTGFKLDGEASNDLSGFSVSPAGDINGDGASDLLIGAYNHTSQIGRSYVVFGGAGIGSSGLIALSGLNGSNGFKLDGEATNDYSGWSVSIAGDINGDGVSDLLIGAPATSTGRSYVVFGGSSVGSLGLMTLSGLNSSTGFKLDGEVTGDFSGRSVSTAGDINGDGVSDLLIGAYGHASGIGRSYVVFGGAGVGSSGLIALSGLNGSTGFKLDGEMSNDYSGLSVSAVGDINGDGVSDLLIGAPNHASQTGRSYVVFGGAGVGSSGLMALSGLNGSTGFKLDGEATNDRSGWSVSTAGDINGDGMSDLLIGAYNHTSSRRGCSYVVFGGPGVGSSGLVALSTLNGNTGFKLDGEALNDVSGYSVSAAGDINGDGVSDLLIGAPGHASSTGRSYVVFGDIPPVLVNNSLSLSVGATISLNASFLATYDRNHNNNTLVFVPSGVTHGQFETVGVPGVSLVNFTQQQITSGAIQFVHDGTLVAPSYNISVFSTGIAWTGPSSAQITFIGAPQSYFPTILSLASLNGKKGFKLDGTGSPYAGEIGRAVSSAGDINNDGYDDLMISAPAGIDGGIPGTTYVVFGGPAVGNGGSVVLANLNSTTGFKILGEANWDDCGNSIAQGGDINGDGFTDLVILAHVLYYGYVVFGPLTGQNNFPLSGLNGTQGYKIYLANVAQNWPVTSAGGDFNHDGYADLMIGSSQCNNKGCTFMLFGSANVGNGGYFTLSNLNGSNGFRLDGETVGDNSGQSVNLIPGDVDGDGYQDLLIGAPGFNNQTGRSYVVWGGLQNIQSGSLSLSNLTNTQVLKLDGENSGDQSGVVSMAGDINGDGFTDFLIGAPYYRNNTGRTYLVFGSKNIRQQGILSLKNLKASDGLIMDGESMNELSGGVSRIGDFNYDGYDDMLVAAGQYANNQGRIYIIFGGPIGPENAGQFNLSDLNGDNGFKIDGETGVGIASVSSAGDINGDGVQDIIIGADRNVNWVGCGYVIFGDAPPTLVQNRLSLVLGQTIVLNQNYLSAYDRNNPNSTIVFIPGNVIHGLFQLSIQPGVSLANFTLLQLQSGMVQLVHDGSTTAPSYDITVQSAGIAWTGPHSANITFSVPPLSIVTNQLILNNGQTVILSLNNLQAVDPGVTNNSQIIFTVSNVQNGYFSTVPSSNSPAKNITSFTQAQIQSGTVEFVHNGDKQAPSYSVLASDGVQSTLPNVATIDLIGAPIITQNSVNVTTSTAITLTSAMLNVTAPSGIAPSQISLTVTNLQHATIISTVTQAPISDFTLADLEAGDIQLTPDNSLITPSYTITATIIPTAFSSAPNTTHVLFSNQGVYAPQLVSNYLTVTQGKATLLSNQYLSAQQPPTDQTLDNSTMFYVSNIEYGHFSLTNQPQTWISSFSQQQLLAGQVQFVQDGSPSIPGYQSQVEASDLFSAIIPASIFFTPVNVPSPVLGGNSGYTTIQKAIISAVVSGTIGILFALVQIGLKRSANKKLLQALGETQDQYDLTVVRPVAKEIARQIKITGCMNHTTNTKMVHFKSAVRTILFELTQRGVTLNFAEMDPPVRDGLINEIARQTRRIVLSERDCCPGLVSFFKAQATPKAIEEAAPVIAEAVVKKLKIRTTAESSAMELPKLSSSQNILLADRSTHSIPPPSPTVSDNPSEERTVAQVLGSS